MNLRSSMKEKARLGWLLLALLGLGFGAVGCRTGGEDLSERPWNSPKSWENGLPSALTEGR